MLYDGHNDRLCSRFFLYESFQFEANVFFEERLVGKRLPRVTVPDFDYKQRPTERLEIPIHERIAAIRARKAEDRARAKAKLERRAAAPPPPRGNRSRRGRRRPPHR